ncbi:uncharacterized protein LOC126898578 [Daktulosphaira vitifoliae]|uniref:uncharacterized protein LOC126898578 n=1 Tax=Daktulosphaira vitifoliae TaxID=58002 RepID=UPI0021AB01C2|nr:uncharacterized protein LOC126898578 [Daktulosphaira vitifoliae]
MAGNVQYLTRSKNEACKKFTRLNHEGIGNIYNMDKTSATSLKIIELISMFESEESTSLQKPLTKEQLIFEKDDNLKGREYQTTEMSQNILTGSQIIKNMKSDKNSYNASTSGCELSVNLSPLKQSDKESTNVLVVIHPWCMFSKSQIDRNSEFPPPGFLEQLKAKFLALQDQNRQSPSTLEKNMKRRRKWCVQYALRGSLCAEKIKLLNKQANLMVNNSPSKTLQ